MHSSENGNDNFIFKGNEKFIVSLEYIYLKIFNVLHQFEDHKGKKESIIKQGISNRKVCSYPFYISSCSNCSKELFNIFGAFFPNDFYGIFSIPVFCALKDPQLNNHLKYLESQKGLNLKIKDKYFNVASEELIKIFLNESIPSLGGIKFTDIEISKDNGEFDYLYVAIDSAIDTLHNQSGGGFFRGNEGDLRSHSGKYDGYHKSVGKKVAINYNDIVSQKSQNRLPFHED